MKIISITLSRISSRLGERARLGWVVSFLALPALLGAKGCEVGSVGSGEVQCGADLGDTCQDDEFCSFDPVGLCGSGELTGTCRPKPKGCTLVYSPVCGCDDETYENACSANTEGQSVLHAGECEGDIGKDDRDCGGSTGNNCKEGEYCSIPNEATCGSTDQVGTCQPVPEVCDDAYDPVCGCNEQTYSNLCEAHAEGVYVASVGTCEGNNNGLCGGPNGLRCGNDEFCKFSREAQCGVDGQTGTCEAKPEGCDDAAYSPMCGCDGETYPNECTAESYGISITKAGMCDEDPEPEGCEDDDACANDEFCDFGARCAFLSDSDQLGVCTQIPEACDKNYAPVCGCDANTYDNACAAAAAGMSTIGNGTCEPSVEPRPCGGIQGLSCEKGEFCKLAEDGWCQVADAGGTCVVMPELCPQNYAPVCGCDGKTYPNRCSADSAGISVAAEGECAGEQKACGGIAGVACDEGEFCNYPVATKCGSGDQMGTCTELPDGCTDNLDPVCGCDNKNYSNECEAWAAGQSVYSKDTDCEVE